MSVEQRSRSVNVYECYEIKLPNYRGKITVTYDGHKSGLSKHDIVGIYVGKKYIGMSASDGGPLDIEIERKELQSLDARVLRAFQALPRRVLRAMGF
ncbi:hypothetical protein HYS50_01900 [Candidatus Woesearchaeota archaeon]|nr:hypothetical protein [Candidatus Woesearchaeota archaeon]